MFLPFLFSKDVHLLFFDVSGLSSPISCFRRVAGLNPHSTNSSSEKDRPSCVSSIKSLSLSFGYFSLLVFSLSDFGKNCQYSGIFRPSSLKKIEKPWFIPPIITRGSYFHTPSGQKICVPLGTKKFLIWKKLLNSSIVHFTF